ncbi:MAG: DNA repair protein RadC [Anaerolineae bacterium]|nr:DNA repair protein RadC [Anaerolineae bacterium]
MSSGDHLHTAFSKSDLPRERLKRLGADALTTAELIAIILRTGTRGENVVHLAERLLREYRGLGGLSRVPLNELTRLKGIGETKAIELRAVFELAHRLQLESIGERPVVNTPSDAAALLAGMGWLEKEEMRVVLLDTKNRVLATPLVYSGSLHTTVIRVGELFREAVRQNCAALIVVHNHPSGDPTPSPEDVAVTREIVQAGKLLDIDVLDHLVIGASNRFVSLKERGLGFG